MGAIERLLAPIYDWLSDGGDPWEMDLEYWRVRRKLMDEGEEFGGLGADVLAALDSAMDVFSPDADRSPDQIDERQLTEEIRAAISDLRALGLTKRASD